MDTTPTPKRATETRRVFPDWPVCWFVELDRALKSGDLQRAGEAQQELRRLGYVVQPSKGGAA